MIRNLIQWFLIAAVILIAGCRSEEPFGPFVVPVAYMEAPVLRDVEEEVKEQLTELQNTDPGPYRIAPQDEFSFGVYEHGELTVPGLVVTPDGFISLPLIGTVNVGGLTLEQATQRIEERYSKFIKRPRISLIPTLVRGYSFTIAGRVNAPGVYPIAIGQTRVMDAIALAKGFSQGMKGGSSVELADLDNAYISRGGKILPVRFGKVIKGDSLHNIPVQNGDYIFIPSAATHRVALLGEVRSQTHVYYEEGLTLMTALAYGGGLLDSHNAMVKIIRGGLEHPVVYNVNVNLMLEGKIQDFPLAGNDIVFVPKEPMSSWNAMVHKILPTLSALSMLAGPFGNPAGYMDLTGN